MNYAYMGSQVMRLRKQKGLTQSKLAELMGVSTSFVGHIERGSRKASLETAVKLSDILKTPLDELVTKPSDDLTRRGVSALTIEKARRILETALALCASDEA